MGKYASHIRVPVSLFKNDIFLGLAGRNKADCLAILVVLLRYSNQKTGECYPRLAHMHSLLGLSKATIYRRIKLMVSIGLLKKKRLSSTNLYKLNPILMVGSSQGDVSDTSVGLISAVRLTGINKDNFNIYLNRNNSNNKMDNDNRIDDIINRYKNDKDVLISTLSKFLQTTPLAEHNKLLNNPTYKWYMKLVLEYRQQELRQKKLLPETIAKQKITEALQANGKKRSERYVARVKYNKANGIKPWESKKNKF
jgi:hypothetical protein